MFDILEDRHEGLHLELADGQGWSLIAAEPLRPWLQKFGALLHLESGKNNGLPNIFFIPSNLFTGKDILRADMSASAISRTRWQRHKLPGMVLWTNPSVTDIVCEIGPEESHSAELIRMWISVDVIHIRALQRGSLPLHAGLVVKNESGVLLAGPGGVGKSTCCERIPLPWSSPCDDQVLIVDTQDEFRCHPFPTWSDYLWGRSNRALRVQEHFAVKGILFLEQGQKDHIRPIGQGEAAMLINRSAKQVIFNHLGGMKRHESAALNKMVFHNACELSQRVPTFILSVEPNGSFWSLAQKALNL
jgi:SynChlorMet cassette protein ScmC